MSDIINPQIDLSYLLIAISFPAIVTTYISVNRWRTFLSMIDVEENTWNLTKINLVSAFLGIVLPSSQGFDFLRIYKIEKAHPAKRGVVGSTVLVERIIGLICLLFIAVISWISVENLNSLFYILSLASVLLFMIIAIVNNKIYNVMKCLLQSIPFGRNIFNYIGKLYEGLHTFPFNKNISQSIMLIFLLQLSNIFVVYLLFLACGVEIDFIHHLCYQPLISVMTMIPITFGGVGIREGGFVFFYSQLGVPNSTVILVSLLYYISISIVPALVGGCIYLLQTMKILR